MDELSRLIRNAQALVRDGYYRVEDRMEPSPSFLDVLGTADQPSDVIAEIKFASPNRSSGKSVREFEPLLRQLVAAKPLGLSVLAEPRIFGGDLAFVRSAAGQGLPVLVKDVIVDPRQIEAASACVESAVLVIQTIFTRRLLEGRSQDLIDAAHDRDLDVVLEVHSPEDWDGAVATDADVLGINNRDLGTMEVDLSTTTTLLASRPKDRPVIAMSGIERRAEVDEALRAGADAVLVGSSIMAHPDPGKKLGELLHG